jgi:acyl carrier protein
MGLDTVELVMSAEKHFGITIPDELAAKVYTVEDFAKLLYELLFQAGKPMPYDEVLLQIRKLTSEHTGIPIVRIVPEASFTKDLGLD